MTILYEQDWANNPNAIVHLETSNKSFLDVSMGYRATGVKNHSFMLALLNPALRNVDPHDPDLSIELKAAVAIEARDNPFYFFRECVRFPGHGLYDASYRSFQPNRGNMAALWSWLNGLDVGWQQIRQTYQKPTIMALYGWLVNMKMISSLLLWGVKDDALKRQHVVTILGMLDLLPPYLDLRTDHDKLVAIDSREIPITPINNLIKFPVAEYEEKRAYNQGRGLTARVLVMEDMPYYHNAHISLPILAASTHHSRVKAVLSGAAGGFIIPTVAGKLDTREGKFTHDLFSSFAPWSDKFFDLSGKEALYKKLRSRSKYNSPAVYISMNHRDLGYTDEWLRKRIEESRATGDDADREFFNIWTGTPYQVE
jgi:hypothetical protein